MCGMVSIARSTRVSSNQSCGQCAGWEHFEGGNCLTAQAGCCVSRTMSLAVFGGCSGSQARQISPELALARTDLLAAEATRRSSYEVALSLSLSFLLRLPFLLHFFHEQGEASPDRDREARRLRRSFLVISPLMAPLPPSLPA